MEALEINEIIVDINLDGSAIILINISVNQNDTLVLIPLLGEPETYTIKATASDGSLVPFNRENGNLIINVINSPSPIKLEYSTNTLTSKKGRFWNATLSLNHDTLVKLPKGAYMIGINSIPQDIYVKDDRIHLVLAPKEWLISYFIPPLTIISPTLKTTTPSPITSPTTTTEQALQQAIPIPIWVIGIIATLGALGVFLALITLRRKKVYKLRPDDARILEYIKKCGGEAFESDIVKDLNIPKTTVWRAIRRLSEANLVRLEREENRVKVIAK